MVSRLLLRRCGGHTTAGRRAWLEEGEEKIDTGVGVVKRRDTTRRRRARGPGRRRHGEARAAGV